MLKEIVEEAKRDLNNKRKIIRILEKEETKSIFTKLNEKDLEKFVQDVKNNRIICLEQTIEKYLYGILENKNVQQLKSIARDLNIFEYYNLNRNRLIIEIRKARDNENGRASKGS